MPRFRIRRGTRAQADAAASASGLLSGEPLLLTDESRLAVATATNAYSAAARQVDVVHINVLSLDPTLVNSKTVDQTTKLQQIINTLEATYGTIDRMQHYAAPRVVVDFNGWFYAISRTLTITKLGFVTFTNGTLVALSSANWSSDRLNTASYMVNVSGVSSANFVRLCLGFEFRLNLECHNVANGLVLWNNQRAVCTTSVYRPRDVGIYLRGSLNHLTLRDCRVFETEGWQPDHASYNYKAVGFLISAGDCTLEGCVAGFIRDAVELIGPYLGIIHFSNCHFFPCAKEPSPFFGEFLKYDVNVRNEFDVIFNGCYFDRGYFNYRGGKVTISGSCWFLYWGSDLPADLTANIIAIAPAPNEPWLMYYQQPRANYRFRPHFKIVENSGNNWADIPTWISDLQAADVITTAEPLVLVSNRRSLGGNDPQQMRFKNLVLASRRTDRTVFELRDANTTDTQGPQVCAEGNDLVFRTNNTTRLVLSASGQSIGQVLAWNGSRWAPQNPSGSGQSAIQFQDEGNNLGSAGTVNTVNFTGAGVTASRSGNVVTVNVAGGGGGGGGPVLPDTLRRPFYYFPMEHIGAGLAPSFNGSGYGVFVSNGAFLPQYLVDAAPMWVQFNKGNTASGWAQLYCGEYASNGQGMCRFVVSASRAWNTEILFAVHTMPTSANDWLGRFGFTLGDPHQAATGGAFFWYDASQTKWVARTRNSAITDTNTGVSLTTSTVYKLRVRLTSTSAEFYIDDVLVATHTTNLPGSARVGAFVGLTGVAGTTSINNVIYTSEWLTYWEEP